MDLTTVDELLTTTRSVRKRLDLSKPVDPEVIERCIEIAFQAPTGSNMQGWSFVIVTDERKRRRIGELYARAFADYQKATAHLPPPYAEGDPRREQLPRVADSAQYLAEHLHEVPVHVIPCVKRPPYALDGNLGWASIMGSIHPATWSFMLALRARGLGSAWTTLHLFHEREIGELLGIPERVLQTALLPVAHFRGETFRPAARLPARDLTHWNSWGSKAAT